MRYTLLDVVRNVSVSELALLVLGGLLLAGNEGLAVLVNLQLGNHNVGRVDADVDRGAWKEKQKRPKESVCIPEL